MLTVAAVKAEVEKLSDWADKEEPPLTRFYRLVLANIALNKCDDARLCAEEAIKASGFFMLKENTDATK